jgi:hypothetical protein
MKAVRIILHGFVLFAANLIGIIAGFAAYSALGARDQLGTQLPIGALLSVLLYLACVLFLRILSTARLNPQDGREYVLAGVCSLLWNPILIVPLHYFTQGYLTSSGNIVALAAFQFPVNAIAILVTWKITQPKDGQLSSEAAPCASPDEVSS